MIKVNIYTVYSAYNYGAFLQAYALQQTFRSLGAQPAFIPSGRSAQPGRSTYGGLQGIKALLLRHLRNPRVLAHYAVRNIHMKMARRLLNVAKTPENGALPVIGSDEVWNAGNGRIGFVPEFYGIGLPGSACYAVSCGETPDISRYPAEAIEGIGKIARASARDITTAEFYRAVAGRECPVVLDPVFLYDFGGIHVGPVKKPYLLVYGKFDDAGVTVAATDFAESCGLQLVSCGIYNAWCGRNIACGPFRFLSVFGGASYVLTNTFHGAAFSVIFGKQFAAFVRSAKTDDFLDMLGLSGRKAAAPEDVARILRQGWDRAAVMRTVEKKREQSLGYIASLLGPG